jgi:glucan 1,6-alpha-isomaltosidase
MALTRRSFLAATGTTAAAGALAAAAPAVAADPLPGQPDNPVSGSTDNPVPKRRARNSLRGRNGRPGLQWTTYGYNFPHNSNIPEAVWKADIDWFIKEFGPYGYDTICTDGWIESSQRITKNGYIISQNDEWTHDFSYWIQYLAARGFKLSLYYNPFWITESARTDRSVRVAGRPDIAVADLTADFDPFTKDKIYWLDPTKPGAKEYAQGYVKYFKRLGAVRLRTDFVSWFENGWDQNLGQIQREHGRLAYLDLLEWLDEAAGPDFELSLVLPHMYFHGLAERPRTDSFRVDDDAGNGGWSWLSAGRQSWQPFWTQWHNPFTGFTGWSDVNGPGLIGLDGDFLIASSFATDDERRTAISLFIIAGSPICVSDTPETIGNNAWVFENPEVIALNKQGLAGKPIYHSDHGWNWDQSSRDTERWWGQLPDGSWIIGLFNRSDGTATRSIDFVPEVGLTNPVAVRDLWAHKDLGALSSYSATLPAHGCALLKLTPPSGPRRYDAELGGWSGHAIFNNVLPGFIGTGYAAGLDDQDSAVSFAVDGGPGGGKTLTLRYALDRGGFGAVTVTVQSGSQVDAGHSQRVALHGGAGAWSTQTTSVRLQAGRNLIIVTGSGRGSGVNLDSISLS